MAVSFITDHRRRAVTFPFNANDKTIDPNYLDPPGPYKPQQHTDTIRSVAGGLIKLRGRNDNHPQRWWFASTAIPLVAATIGPLSNVLSIAALVTPWRVTLPDNGAGLDDFGVGIEDPHWEIISNAFSLACGFAGNLFLLLNFTGRVRYIIAIPLSILLWILSSLILIATELAMHISVPPVLPGHTYSQGFWHAVLASIFYLAGSSILMINLVGYFRGHYPQQFDLDDDQRTLILQTTMFFFWLAGGAAVFCALEDFTYPDALYFADVTVLTIGFGDFAPKTDSGRGFLLVFQLVGIIFLGLVISSISRFAANISADKIIKRHQDHARASTVGRTVTSEKELRERLGLPPRSANPKSSCDTTATNANSRPPDYYGRHPSFAQYGKLEIIGRTVTFIENKAEKMKKKEDALTFRDSNGDDGPGNSASEKRKRRRQKLLLLREEKDRFDAMRQIQAETRRWKQYWALSMAFLAFFALWCLGALVFMLTEARIQNLRYFDALYFSWVSLLTIGYGDIAPKSNIGKPFFIVWSLVAVPIVTVLIQEMSKTVVTAVNRGIFKFADWTIMPKKGVLNNFLDTHPSVLGFMSRLFAAAAMEKAISQQAPQPIHQQEQKQHDYNNTANHETVKSDSLITPKDQAADGTIPRNKKEPTRTIDSHSTAPSPPITTTPNNDVERQESCLANKRPQKQEKEPETETEHALANQLAISIQSVAHHLLLNPPKQYSYDEWAYFIKLMRFTTPTQKQKLSSSPCEENCPGNDINAVVGDDADVVRGEVEEIANKQRKKRREEGAEEETVKDTRAEMDSGPELVVEWDWIGENSPMLADITEAEWVLDKLCESLERYIRSSGDGNE